MNKNPFVLPGLGQSGPNAQNPILASMEMMRQAWEGLASTGGVDPASMAKMMSVEDMEKRIADLRAVENWLRMNLSMLSSTIQGLEVQRSTVATLKAFMDTGMATMAQPAASAEPANKDATGRQAEKPSNQTPPQQAARSGDKSGANSQPESTKRGEQPSQEEQPDILGAAATAAQGWWDMLQQQFQTLAAATAANTEAALSEMAEAGKAVAPDSKPAAAKKSAKSASKTSMKTSTKSAAKAAGKAAKAGKTATKASKRPAARKA